MSANATDVRTGFVPFAKRTAVLAVPGAGTAARRMSACLGLFGCHKSRFSFPSVFKATRMESPQAHNPALRKPQPQTVYGRISELDFSRQPISQTCDHPFLTIDQIFTESKLQVIAIFVMSDLSGEIKGRSGFCMPS
jgi:hypothetical protein